MARRLASSNGQNGTMASSRPKNSGEKQPSSSRRNALSRLFSVRQKPKAPCLPRMASVPRLQVITITVFRKSTRSPSASESCPSSMICSSSPRTSL